MNTSKTMKTGAQHENAFHKAAKKALDHMKSGKDQGGSGTTRPVDKN